MNIYATGTRLELVPNGDLKDVRGGRYTILSATDGITGHFASVSVPKDGWTVEYESERLDGVDTVTRIVLTVPPDETVILFY